MIKVKRKKIVSSSTIIKIETKNLKKINIVKQWHFLRIDTSTATQIRSVCSPCYANLCLDYGLCLLLRSIAAADLPLKAD